MDQSRALNALAPFLALAPSATSPRAASDLITQATSAPHVHVFSELLAHPNIHALAASSDTLPAFKCLELFAWGTWQDYKTSRAEGAVPELNEKQVEKLKVLSLLTIAAEKGVPGQGQGGQLGYAPLCERLDLASPLELEQLVTSAIYANLVTATLNPLAQTIVITSVAPLRDPAPGSLANLLGDLTAWSCRCDDVLTDLAAEIAKVEAGAKKRARAEEKRERMVRSAVEGADGKSGGGGKGKGGAKREAEGEDGDSMDVDEGPGFVGGGKKRGGAGGLGKSGPSGRSLRSG